MPLFETLEMWTVSPALFLSFLPSPSQFANELKIFNLIKIFSIEFCAKYLITFFLGQ